jgi:hypothetical protein
MQHTVNYKGLTTSEKSEYVETTFMGNLSTIQLELVAPNGMEYNGKDR